MGAGRQRPGTGARDGARSPPAPPRSRQGCEGRKGERGCVPALRCTRTGDRKVRGGEAPVGSRCSPWHRGRGAKHPSADVLTAVDGGALAVSSAAPSSRTSSRRRGSGRRSGVTGTRGRAGWCPFLRGGSCARTGCGSPGRTRATSPPRAYEDHPGFPQPLRPLRTPIAHLGESRRGRSAANRAEGTEASAGVLDKSPPVHPRCPSAERRGVRRALPLGDPPAHVGVPPQRGRLVGGRRGHRGWGSG
jgi:hypothetical protein